MRLHAFILLTMLACIHHVHASGVRTLKLNLNNLDSFREIKAESLPDHARYVGSTEQWHFFAKTLTSVSHGRPFDNTFAYRVTVKHVKLINGWRVSLTQDNTHAHVNSCPKVTSVNTSNIETVIVISKSAHTGCLMRY